MKKPLNIEDVKDHRVRKIIRTYSIWALLVMKQTDNVQVHRTITKMYNKLCSVLAHSYYDHRMPIFLNIKPSAWRDFEVISLEIEYTVTSISLFLLNEYDFCYREYIMNMVERFLDQMLSLKFDRWCWLL